MSVPSRRVRVVLAYDGGAFSGWQIQGRGVRTAQAVLRDALTTLQGGGRVVVRGAGRTDAGVHALAQVADAEVRVRLDDRRLLHALRRLLPRDLRPLALETVDASFHSQFHALDKGYVYVLDRTEHGDPFLAGHAWHVYGALDLRAMQQALAKLPGERDWSGFTGAACPLDDRVRSMTVARYTEHRAAGLGRFEFVADGFLTHMVRNLVGTLVTVGRGSAPAEVVDTILASGDRTLAGVTAPARGLFLARVRYPGLDTATLAPEVPWPWAYVLGGT